MLTFLILLALIMALFAGAALVHHIMVEHEQRKLAAAFERSRSAREAIVALGFRQSIAWPDTKPVCMHMRSKP